MEQPPKQQPVTQISQKSKYYVLSCNLSRKVKNFNINKDKILTFPSFENRGKYKQLQYSYNSQQKILEIKINKKFYSDILMHKKYELVLFAKCAQSSNQQFLQTLKALINSDKIKNQQYQIAHLDVIGLTLRKQFIVINHNFQKQKKIMFLRMSLVDFRRNLLTKAKQCQQYFSAIFITVPIQTKTTQQINMVQQSQQDKNKHKQSEMIDEKEQKNKYECPLPKDQQFYNAPRVSFIDDLYSSQSLLKRFNRFMIFYQVHSLFLGTVPPEHPLVRQFYQKCLLRCSIISTRLKKINIDFKFVRPQASGNFKQHTATLTLISWEQDALKQEKFVSDEKKIIASEKFQLYNNNSAQRLANKDGNLFIIQLYCDTLQLDKKYGGGNKVQQKFLAYLKQITHDPKNKEPFVQYFQFLNFKTVRILNQIGFCQILVELSKFVDVFAFSSLGTMQTQYKIQRPDDYYDIKVPFNNRHYRGTKFITGFSLQIKMILLPVQQKLAQNRIQSRDDEQRQRQLKQLRQLTKQIRFDKIQFKHVVSKMIMMKKKLSGGSNNQFENTDLGFCYIKGLNTYIEEIIKRNNIRDCYNQLQDVFSPAIYAVSKPIQKNEGSNIRFTPIFQYIMSITSCMLQSLCKIFMSDKTCLYMINDSVISQIHEASPQKDIFQLMWTFKVMKATSVGWVLLIPSFVYMIQLNKVQATIWKTSQKNKQKIDLNIFIEKDKDKDKDKLDKEKVNRFNQAFINFFTRKFLISQLEYFDYWRDPDFLKK